MMRKLLTILTLAASTSLPAVAEVNVNIGIHIPAYPDLQPVPGYPVYYAPGLRANYFFYDGEYWVYLPDGWYVSPWYDGPWHRVGIDSVPLFVLRVPVRYYGYRPVAFRRWGMDAPPRWDVVWGPRWARRHHDWNHWNRAVVPPPAPLPLYQQRYPRGNYPNDAQRRELHQQHYNYAPRETHAPRPWRPRPADIDRHPQPAYPERRPEPRFVERDHPRANGHVQGPRMQAAAPRPADIGRQPDRRPEPRFIERDHPRANGQAPGPRMQAPEPRPSAMPGNPGPRGPSHNGRQEHPSHPDKHDRGGEHGQGKQH
ncbi:MAG TPA: hypothetical protein VFS95_09545 [Telluria sp.]|nr:hypothetical protein [Telluria sp.]